MNIYIFIYIYIYIEGLYFGFRIVRTYDVGLAAQGSGRRRVLDFDFRPSGSL